MDEQSIGANIRGLRGEAGVTLTALAKKAGMTKSTLSKIENGQVSPPISTLMRLAEALDVRLAEFFREADGGPAYVLTRKGQGRIISRDGSRLGYSYEGLALEMQDKLGEPFVLTIRPGDPVGEFQHGGEEFVYVLAGRMEFEIGDDVLKLGAGDSLYFDPNQVHRTRVLGTRPVRFVCVFIQDRSRRGRKEK